MPPVVKNEAVPQREMACYLCGCIWWVEGEKMTDRPPCPECGGCRETGKHMFDCFPDGWGGHWPRTAAAFKREEPCPEDSLCTTAAVDTLGHAYNVLALEQSGYIPEWHQYELPGGLEKDQA